jgi:hypothetical protein
VKETGAYTGQLKVMYEAMIEKLESSNQKIIELVNKAWPGNKEFDMKIGMEYARTQMSPEWNNAWTRYESVRADVEAFKLEVKKQA